MDLNLDTLKQEILEYLEQSEFAVFRSAPGGLEGLPMYCGTPNVTPITRCSWIPRARPAPR
jgi:hypothetical protein